MLLSHSSVRLAELRVAAAVIVCLIPDTLRLPGSRSRSFAKTGHGPGTSSWLVWGSRYSVLGALSVSGGGVPVEMYPHAVYLVSGLLVGLVLRGSCYVQRIPRRRVKMLGGSAIAIVS